MSKKKIIGIILAAGQGTRMRPLSLTMSKPMLPIHNRPMVYLLAEEFISLGIDCIYLIVSPKNKEEINSYFKNHPLPKPVTLELIVQKEQLGTAHALLQAKSKIFSQFVFVVSGDNLFSVNILKKVINEHLEYNPMLTMVLKEADLSEIPKLSSVKYDENQFITKIIEKPKPQQIYSRYAATANYIFHKDFFNVLEKVPLSQRGEYEVPTAIQMLISSNKQVRGVITDSWIHLSNPIDLWEVNILSLEHSIIADTAIIEKNTKISRSVIGENSRVYEGCTLDQCLVLSNTILSKDVKVSKAIIYSGPDKKTQIYKVQK